MSELKHIGKSQDVTWVLTGQLDQQEAVRKFRIHTSPFRIGRQRDLMLTIPCPTVSSQHADLIVDGERLIVRDLGSTNGTFVNGVRIKGDWDLNPGDLLQFAGVVFRLGRETINLTKRTAVDQSGDGALALVQFDKLMTERAVVPYFQPIVDMTNLRPIGYEVLGRSRIFGLRDPKAMFMAAALLSLEADLSRIFRWEGAVASADLPGPTQVFLNTHPTELKEPDLFIASLRELRDDFPEVQLVLEIHESAVTRPAQMRELRTALDDLNIQLAYDDFGAGQARLVELAEVPPDFLKFDLCLIQGIDNGSPTRQKMLESLVLMVRDLGIASVAECVETDGEHQVCSQLGFEFGQGFFYGRPAPVNALVAPV